jgi:hypothetical protein
MLGIARHLDRIAAAWGDVQVSGLTMAGIFRLRAQFENTPVAANHLVSMLRTLLDCGLSHGYGERNPADDVENLEIDNERHAKPWPEEAYEIVLKVAPKRLVYLARASGQRRSDIVKFRKRT